MASDGSGAWSPLTGTSFQYHLEGDCSGSRGEGRRGGSAGRAHVRTDRWRIHVGAVWTQGVSARDPKGKARAPLHCLCGSNEHSGNLVRLGTGTDARAPGEGCSVLSASSESRRNKHGHACGVHASS